MCNFDQTRVGRSGKLLGFSEIIVPMPFAEPPPELVERAIVKLLEITQLQGITPVDFIQMLDSGMRISDFLHAVDVAAGGYTIGDTVN